MQQLAICAAVLLISLGVYYLLGWAVCARYHWNLVMPEIFCVGFFLYHALFQVIAEIMIFSKQRLHVLGRTWLVILILLLVLAVSTLRMETGKGAVTSASVTRIRPGGPVRLLLWLMAAAVICECATALLLQRSIGWDFAYYIGNMTTSVSTDTMYLYDGSSGMLRETMELRYALSSFYMNTAWISQMTGVSALLLQKYVTGIVLVLLANAIVYSFAMEVFLKDKKKAALVVTITILMNVFWDVYDTSAQFLFLRGYEAKAYCANVVLPMTVYLCFRIWNKPEAMRNWAELFLVAFASVAVSMSSILLVPAAIGIMMLAQIIVSRQGNWTFVRRTIYCLLPNVFYLLVYFASTKGWLVVRV